MSKHKKKQGGPRLKIVGQFIGHPVAMIHILRGLSLTARRILDTLEIEHCQHGGRENGKLACTYSNFENHVPRSQISKALRKLVAVGLIEIPRIGRRAYADLPRTSSLYRLTYLPTFQNGKWIEATHDWKQKARPESTTWPRPESTTWDAKSQAGIHHLGANFQGRNPPLLSRDLGEEGGGLTAGCSTSLSSSPAPSHQGVGLDAPSPVLTVPSSESVH